MTAAHRLYLSLGFREISSYGGDAVSGTRYFGLRVSPDPSANAAAPGASDLLASRSGGTPVT